MKFKNIGYDTALLPFIKSIMIYECDVTDTKTNLPFFADGFPGLMYHETPNGLFVNLHKKRMTLKSSEQAAWLPFPTLHLGWRF